MISITPLIPSWVITPLVEGVLSTASIQCVPKNTGKDTYIYSDQLKRSNPYTITDVDKNSIEYLAKFIQAKLPNKTTIELFELLVLPPFSDYEMPIIKFFQKVLISSYVPLLKIDYYQPNNPSNIQYIVSKDAIIKESVEA